MTGTVLWGVNNIYSVAVGENDIECRIKGKVLEGIGNAYNPLAPGDGVEVKIDETDRSRGLILKRHDRNNSFARWNKKKQAPQVIAADIDLCYCITSPDEPPFRPRFIDRVGVMAGISGIPVTVVCNKADLPIPEVIRKRLKAYTDIGFGLRFCCALTGEGIEDLQESMTGKRALFVGQSGVGKTTIINALVPGLARKTGEISAKYNRGKHTTVFSELLRTSAYEIIDTPGIREIEVFGINKHDVMAYFPDLFPFKDDCRYPSCLHIDEPGCCVKTAVAEVKIHPDRYESYVRIVHDLAMKERIYG